MPDPHQTAPHPEDPGHEDPRHEDPRTGNPPTGNRPQETVLHDWTLHGSTPDGEVVEVPGRAPGCVMDDLVRAGVIPDPRREDLEASVRWVGETGWTYRCPVRIEARADHHELEFDGLDTVTTVRWDGTDLAHTRDMHRRHRLDLGAVATPGEHELVVTFAAPEHEAAAAQSRLGKRPNAYDRPFEAIRKAAYTFGWDWGPDFPSAGIWRPARLVSWSTARLGDVRVETRRDDVASGGPEGRGGPEGNGDTEGTGTWTVSVHADVRADAGVRLRASLLGEDVELGVPAGTSTQTLTLQLRDPELWWPHSHGTPTLHDLRVELTGAAGLPLDGRDLRIGIREIVLAAEPDAAGRAFGFSVNGEPVFVRGLNWIPDSSFPGVATDLGARLDDAVDAHQNLLRVWGGGFYESEEFYTGCDERGLLVWQDFLFACAAYPEDAELADEVAAEARDNVSRLQHHPSLALWNGNNENLWGFEEWWSEAEIGGRSWGVGYYTDLLPGVVADLDPTRAYWPGSPASGPDYPARTASGDPVRANDEAHGCQHLWTEWNDVDHEYYLTHRPRFVSEFGYQAPPAWSTMVACLGGPPSGVDDARLAVHQKAEGGMGKLERGLLSHGGPASDLDDWWWRTQHIQASAVRLGVGHLRSLMPHCQGSIWWQLNDCWPVISWAVVDSAGQRKPAWYALRETSADRLVTVLGGSPDGSGCEVGVVNDTPTPWAGTLVVERYRLSDATVTVTEHEVDLPPRSAYGTPVPDTDGCLTRARLDEVVSPGWFAEADRAALPEPEWDVEAERSGQGWQVTVTARSLVVDLTVFPDRLHPRARVDTALVTLLPGASHTFVITGAADADPDAFTGAPVVRAVGDQRRR